MTLPSTMRAQVLTSFNNPYDLLTRPLPPSPTAHDALIKVHAASYCHTDFVYASGAMGKTLPLVPCHEYAGTVIALGPLARNVSLGDRVGVPGRAYRPCGDCWECQHSEDADHAQGYSVYCPKAGNNGITRDGGFQEYALVDARQVARIPDPELSFVDTAPLMCAGLTVYAALKRCGLSPGETVGIVGCGGGLGHLGLQFAHEMGFNVIGVDAADGPLKLARECARRSKELETVIVDARGMTPGNVVDEMPGMKEKLPQERGIGAVMILPESQAGFEFGMGLLRPHGICVVVSFPEKGFNVSARDLVFKDVSIVGSLVGSNKCAGEMLEMAAKRNIRARTKVFPLEKLNELVEEYQKMEGGKLVVSME